MRRAAVLAVAAFLPLLTAANDGPASLFDGRTLDGWEQGDHDSFRVENGAIVGGRLDGPIAKKPSSARPSPMAISA